FLARFFYRTNSPWRKSAASRGSQRLPSGGFFERAASLDSRTRRSLRDFSESRDRFQQRRKLHRLREVFGESGRPARGKILLHSEAAHGHGQDGLADTRV